MTSELKPCPLAKALIAAADEVSACGGGNEAAIMRAAANKLTELNTRAVPDVPELVRYGLLTDDGDTWLDEFGNGEYVRYDQAAAVIAAKANEIVGFKLDAEAWKQNCFGWKSAAQAAQAKLDQINNQKPVGYVAGLTAGYEIKLHETPTANIALYAAPVASDADLRAENERLKEALKLFCDAYTDTSSDPNLYILLMETAFDKAQVAIHALEESKP